ncbi:hypothetical protein B0H16DRAFT_1030539 [Mycena metata]|uniref:Uncharacterized protein n=1 Tax=Mycena metata TaxID=1033252 RepID=A0AAD7IGM8_9AGAR|nr:hypothetical protein B0H16DRAFT_1030539 [Mycena metata]
MLGSSESTMIPMSPSCLRIIMVAILWSTSIGISRSFISDLSVGRGNLTSAQFNAKKEKNSNNGDTPESVDSKLTLKDIAALKLQDPETPSYVIRSSSVFVPQKVLAGWTYAPRTHKIATSPLNTLCIFIPTPVPELGGDTQIIRITGNSITCHPSYRHRQ